MLLTLFCAVISTEAQYLGVTCGWQYSSQLSGPPTYPTHANISLYNPDSANPNATWDSWAEQMAQAGVDFVCPNLTGSQPNTGGSPTQMLALLNVIRNRGLTNQIKFAAFDDNAASWTAQWNLANGRGYGYAQKFDMADTNNWRYIYDYNYKVFFQTIPDQNRFKINGRPLIMIWSGNTVTFLTNMQGNASQAIMYVRQRCQADFGFNPFIVLSQDFFSNDSTCNNAGVADGSHSWFIAGPSGPAHTLTTKNGSKIGVAVPQFQRAGQGGFLDPNHGLLFETGLSNTVGQNALLTLCEGFTDYEEDAAMWRVRNLAANGSALVYTNTYYDYPNQRINILRKHSNWSFPAFMKFEAEGCDNYGGAAGGNGKVNYYRNGNIAIEPTSDAGGGHNIGWIQPGEWFEWLQVPIQGSQVYLQARVASPGNGSQLHFQIDGTNYPAIPIPNTGGSQAWTTVECGPFFFSKGSFHTVRIVCDTSGFNLNYWQYRTAIPTGTNVRLQSKANNKWVSAATGSLAASATVPGATELFSIVDASADGYGHGYVALKALANDKYVTADTNGVQALAANADAIDKSQIFQWTDNADGSITLRALANSKLVSATNVPATFPLVPNRIRYAGLAESFVLSPVSSNTLSFIAQPNDTVATTPITAGALGEVQVLAQDAGGNPVTNASISLLIASGVGTIQNNTAATDFNGIAHFTNVTIDRAGTKTLGATSGAFNPTQSAAFEIIAGPATALTVETAADGSGGVIPAQGIAAFANITAYAITRDAGGNFITNLPASWALVNKAGGVVNGDLVPAGDGKSAVFTAHAPGSAQIQATATFSGVSGNLSVVDPTVVFTTGTFTDNSVLGLIGPPVRQVFGVNLGTTTPRTTANGYFFDGFPGTNASYGGSSGYGLGVFMGGGGTSGDASFDSVLNFAQLGINGGVLALSNLTAGTTYKLLTLSADTRSGVGSRAFAISSTGGSSASQPYAYLAGSPALGGYVLATFVASGPTKTFTNTQAGYGYQLNAMLLGQVPPNTPPVFIASGAETSGALSFSGTNGAPYSTYRVLMATNMNTASAAWIPVFTNSFDAAGTFQIVIPVPADVPSAFYRLSVP